MSEELLDRFVTRVAEVGAGIDALADERDALLTERDALRAEVEELMARIEAGQMRVRDIKRMFTRLENHNNFDSPTRELMREVEQIAYSVFEYLNGMPGPNRDHLAKVAQETQEILEAARP